MAYCIYNFSITILQIIDWKHNYSSNKKKRKNRILTCLVQANKKHKFSSVKRAGEDNEHAEKKRKE